MLPFSLKFLYPGLSLISPKGNFKEVRITYVHKTFVYASIYTFGQTFY